jgi:NADH:ubiquinone oxidoreductase subunit E
VCDGTACHVKGAPNLMTAMTNAYGIAAGETTGDGQLTLEIVYCIGSCALAPVAIMDNQVVGRVKEDDLLRRVKRQVS